MPVYKDTNSTWFTEFRYKDWSGNNCRHKKKTSRLSVKSKYMKEIFFQAEKQVSNRMNETMNEPEKLRNSKMPPN